MFPTTPSIGSRRSQRQCQGRSPSAAGRKIRPSSVPVQRSQGEPLGRECIQVHPSPPSHSGIRNAVIPIDCSSRSLSHAPNTPTQLCTACGPISPVEVFNDGSAACQVATESRSSSETSNSSSPRNTFSGRFRVGERTIETGFMALCSRSLPPGILPRASQRGGARVPEQLPLSVQAKPIQLENARGEPRCGPPSTLRFAAVSAVG